MAAEEPPRTIVQKILDAHTVDEEGGRRLVYIDRLILADTATAVFRAIAGRGEVVASPGQALMIPDHYVPSDASGEDDGLDAARREQLNTSQRLAGEQGVRVLGIDDPRRGIQHVAAAEQAYAQPGATVAAADSHTTTLGAVGALAFSVGTDLPHALTTQCVWLKPPRMMKVGLHGRLPRDVAMKDVALALLARICANGAAGHAVEFVGDGIAAASVEERMTLCNMAVEMGAAMAIVAPDHRTYAYLKDRPLAPRGQDWERAMGQWRSLPSDPGAHYDREESIDLDGVVPMVTWGNSAETALRIDAVVPDPEDEPVEERRMVMRRSLEYMGLRAGSPIAGLPIDRVFIGSCTNSRIEDMRAAARILVQGRVVVPTLIVPGSGLVKMEAEREGLADIFRLAGARWGEPGCSMCVSMNGDVVPPGQRCASTSNRNHMGRQGPGSRTHLVSPAMAAAAAIAGRIVDVRRSPAAH